MAIVSLGTGSIGALLDSNGNIHLSGGWGFIVGDEGSGASLGKAAIKIFLAALDQQQDYVNDLSRYIHSVIGRNRNAIVEWLSRAQACDFAVIAPKILQLADHCLEAKELIQHHLLQVNQLILTTRADSGLPVVLMGGLAAASRPHLPASTQKILMSAKGTVLDGACFLARRYVNE